MLYKCWNKNPEKRPTFHEVVNLFTSRPRLITPCLEDPSVAVKNYNNMKITRNNQRRASHQGTTIYSTNNEIETNKPLLKPLDTIFPPALPPRNGFISNHKSCNGSLPTTPTSIPSQLPWNIPLQDHNCHLERSDTASEPLIKQLHPNAFKNKKLNTEDIIKLSDHELAELIHSNV